MFVINNIKIINKMRKIILLASIGILFCLFSCENDESEIIRNNEINSIENKKADTGLPILHVSRGKKKGTWPRCHCEGKKGWCFIWFQKPYNPPVRPYANYSINNNTLIMNIDYSPADSTEQTAWEEDINLGYVELADTIRLADTLFLNAIGYKNPIILKSGRHTITNAYDKHYEVKIPFILEK